MNKLIRERIIDFICIATIIVIMLSALGITLDGCFNKVHATEWCFTEGEAQNLCVLMEKCDSYKEQIGICLQANSELEQENVLLKQNNKLSSENLGIEKEINKTLKERIILGEKVCDKKVEEAKPKFKDKFTWFGTGYGAGILTVIGIGVLLL